MTDMIAQSGSDDDGLIALGNSGLSILDLLQSGHMPMCGPPSMVWITYNGKVYDSKKLRIDLEKRGYGFKSSIDTETVPKMYINYGTERFAKFIEMFRFAIWSSRFEELFTVLDRFGIRPLYFTSNERVCFGF